MTSRVVIVDYGIGNLFSVARAVEAVGGEPVISSNPNDIISADRLILPGVGAFERGLKGLDNLSLTQSVKSFAASGRPFLGICLGMQMMLETGTEFGLHEGLGLVPGSVEAIPPQGADGKPHKIPHIGWNGIHAGAHSESWENGILKGIEPSTTFYLVHSYVAKPSNPTNILATCDYNGLSLTAVVQSEMMFGCQFHPEKSGSAGLRVLENFMAL